MRIMCLAVTLLALASTNLGAQRREVCGTFNYACKERQAREDSIAAANRSRQDSVPVRPVQLGDSLAPAVTAPKVSDSVPAKPDPTPKRAVVIPRVIQSTSSNDRFSTAKACLDALMAGTARYYQPSFLKPVPLASIERTIALEHDACVRMQIVGGVMWVPQQRGTQFDFRGSRPFRRTDCGNRVFGIEYPAAPPTAPSRTDTLVIARDSTFIIQTDTVERRVVERIPTTPTVKKGFPIWRTLGAVALGTAIACEYRSQVVRENKPLKFKCGSQTVVEVDQVVVQALRALRR